MVKNTLIGFIPAGPAKKSRISPVTTIEKKKISNDTVELYPKKQTNWYVITGGPGSGKTTTIKLLQERGYTTTIEHARHYLDTQLIKGKSVEEVKQNQRKFQLGVLEMQIEQEASLNPDEIVFLDRALPDALAYYRFLNLSIDERLVEALRSASYKKVFILDLLPLVQDYARREDEAAQKKIHELLIEVYRSFGFHVIRVPVLPPEERVDFILRNISAPQHAKNDVL